MTGTLARRLDALESAAGGPKGPPRIVVLYPGDPEYDSPNDNDNGDDARIVLRVVYDDPPTEVHDGIETTTVTS